MGEVYKAWDTHLERHVALKVISPERLANPEHRRRFAVEAKAASALNHPGIVTIYDIGHADGIDFIAMELVEGSTLEALLAKGPLPEKRTLAYGAQIAEALSKAHAAGIIHRDLKPSNIMITPDETVRVLDFGLAKLLSGDAPKTYEGFQPDSQHTVEGRLLGTLAYMAPEQAQGQPVDARSDIYSFGLILFEMLTGKRPLAGSGIALLASLASAEMELPSQSVPGISPAVDRMVMRCLRKDPHRRWQSMADLKLVLEDLQKTTFQWYYWLRRRPLPWIGAGVATLLLGAAVPYLFTERSRPARSATAVTRSLIKLEPGIDETCKDCGENHLPDRTSVALSRDGTFLVYSAHAFPAGKFQLYLRRLDQLESKAIPGTEGARCPFLSPDGQWVGFFPRDDS